MVSSALVPARNGHAMDLSVWADRLEGMRHQLVEAYSAQECLKIADATEAIRVLLKQAGACKNDQNLVCEIKVRAERKAGELIAKEPIDKGGRPKNPSQHVTGLGNGHDDSCGNNKPWKDRSEKQRCQLIAAIPSRAFEQEMGRLKKASNAVISSQKFIRMGLDIKKEKIRKQLAESATKLDSGILVGSFQQLGATVPDNSVSLIFTDPPYARKDLPLYADLAAFANRVLIDGGSLITYLGTYALPEVLPMLAHGKMRYCWQLIVKHECTPARNFGPFTYSHYKPLLWFTKGPRAGRGMIADFIQSKRPDKVAHDWMQSHVEAAYLIEHLTKKGDMVCDPMCGSGTTLRVAKEMGRQYLGIEVDPARALAASKLMEA